MTRNSGKNQGKGNFKPKSGDGKKPFKRTFNKDGKPGFNKDGKPIFQKKKKGDPLPTFSNEVRLNKFIANTGICSRREADVLIQTGVVEVNGKIIQELGYKVKPTDEVKFDGQLIRSEKKQYVLLNKPKDFAVSSDRKVGRNVIQLTKNACKEHIAPIGKMDKKWTGVILLTNDTDMVKRLTHPKHPTTSIYHAEFAKPLSPEDKAKFLEGFDLESGGFLKAEKVEAVKGDKSREYGIEIRTNKNRPIEKLAELVGNTVVKLDRVSYAGLTKKDTPRGNWRHLERQEIDFLKMV